MSNISAGIGRGQMEVLDDRIAKRREHFAFYRSAFAGLVGVQLQEEPSDDYFSNHWLSAILIDPSKTGDVDREAIRLALDKKGIETRPLWKPMHLQPVFKDCAAYVNGVSESLFKDGLCLPSSSNMTDEERDFVVESIKELL
jgi:dTDP-4-amino-4,6-dideoxygalactose transaminase